MFDKAEPEEPEKACLLRWLKSGAVSMFLLRRASANLERAVFVSETEMQRSLGNKQDSPNHEQSYGGGWAQGLRVKAAPPSARPTDRQPPSRAAGTCRSADVSGSPQWWELKLAILLQVPGCSTGT